VVLWGTNLADRTEPVTQFAWTKDSANALLVLCQVTFAGHELIAKAYFDVRRPTARWTIRPKNGTVTVSTNQANEPPQYAGYYYLSTGPNSTTNNVGMYYSCEMIDLAGYVGPHDFFMAQVVTLDWKYNSVVPNASFFMEGFRGIDTQYPYGWYPGQGGKTETTAWTTDSPWTRLIDIYGFFWRRDSFECYLLWQSRRRASIPVPLSRADWSWYGRAERISTNSPGVFQLRPPGTDPQLTVGVNWYTHPTWTNNTQRAAYTFNNFWYTTP
jgi:hypothetical protein